MGAYSTLRITRARAMQALYDALHNGTVTDEMLGKFMSEILEPRLFNCTVVPTGTADNDDDRL